MAGVMLSACATPSLGQTPPPATPPSAYASWSKGPGASPDYFPIAVWLQDPRNAPRYKELGINLYVGLWKGPTEPQLAALEKAGMPVLCAQNEFALRHLDRKIIVGWLQPDEPDNAQSPTTGKGYDPPVPPEKVQAAYQQMHQADPDRPVLLNLGQGVAWDGWYGRGVRTHKPEDYPAYLPGGDIVSFDIYPAVATHPDVAGKLWLVPFGVDRLRQWSHDQKPVWTCIETTRISNPTLKPTPRQVQAEVWMALIHGARGLIYFAHEFKPKFIEAGLLADPEMAATVRTLNHQILRLAPVLNSPTVPNAATVTSSSPDVPLDIMVKRHGGATYVFAVAMREGQTTATFTVGGAKGTGKVEVLDEGRDITAKDGRWEDEFAGYGARIYRVMTGDTSRDAPLPPQKR